MRFHWWQIPLIVWLAIAGILFRALWNLTSEERKYSGEGPLQEAGVVFAICIAWPIWFCFGVIDWILDKARRR